LKDRADLSRSTLLETRREKTRYVFDALRATAKRSQAPLADELTRRGISFRSYFVINALLVNADRALVEELSRRPEVKRIDANPTFNMLHAPVAVRPALDAANGVEWNVQATRAPEVWAQGFKGQGLVVAGADTGVEWSHPAIVRQYRGSTNGSVDHNHNWFSAFGSSDVPFDDHSHGTFTVGQMVGDDGHGNQIGVAPEARWIACKNMNAAGAGTPQSYITCFEWFIAPTDLQGQDPNPDMAPDIINNSWSCPETEGCNRETLHEIVNTVQAAGIMLVFSAGNSGPSCSSVNEPPAFYPELFSVGATDSSSVIASFSSRGPSSYDRGAKPNISAPGVNVRSSVPGGNYSYMSGTSMAAPEVASSIALLWSANPSRIGDREGVSSALEDSATYRFSARCGGSPASGYNHTYGFGLLDVKAALDAYSAP